MNPFLFDGMVWSYSRITSFYNCPYAFFLKYIDPQPAEEKFFSQFGSFVHGLFADFYRGEKRADQIVTAYLTGFYRHVTAEAPSEKVFSSYFLSGLEAVKRLERPKEEVVGVERRFFFTVGPFRFVAFVDLLTRNADGGLIITDHKSRALKPRSGRAKPTAGDRELEEYLRQLYLYAAAVEQAYGELPAALRLNCYRTGTVIDEPFDRAAYERVKRWAEDSIREIMACRDFVPYMDFFRCRHMCNYCSICEYLS